MDALRIILHVHRLGMSGIAVTNLLIGRIFGVAVSIPHVGVDDSVQLVQIRLHPPKAASCKPYLPVACCKRRLHRSIDSFRFVFNIVCIHG